ncbi:MAG: T9SS type A sorting domain-containing protein [Bacteroidota bacterium]
MLTRLTVVMLLALLGLTESAWAQAVDDFRSHQTGNWSNTSTWARWSGSAWVNPAPNAPSSADGAITIRNGHTVTATGTSTVDQVTIEAGGQVTLNSGVTQTFADGSGTDLSVSGTYRSAGTMTRNSGATIAFNSGGTYQHNYTTTAGTVPTATWNANSTCEIIGYTSNTSTPTGLNQTLGHFTWNCPSQTSTISTSTNLTTVNGNFTVANTGTGAFRPSSSNNVTLNIGGNWIHTGGTYRIANGAGTKTVNIAGSFQKSGGTLEMSTASGSATVTMNVTGSFTSSAGSITELGSGTHNIVFGTSSHTFTSGGTISNTVNFLVNSGATLLMASNATAITGGGAFTLASGATLGITSPSGITTSGATGNIQVTGTRTYNAGATYLYNGTAAQAPGNGLPATVTALTMNNAAGLALSGNLAISGTLTLTNGDITTGANTLTVGTGTSVLGSVSRTSGKVIGNFRRWFAASTVSNALFPIGTASHYRPASISFTSAPSAGGTLAASFVASDPGENGLPLVDVAESIVNCSVDGYWVLTAANGLTGGLYSLGLTATGFASVSDFLTLRILKRNNSANPWTLNGNHANGTGSNAVPTANRTGMSGFSEFGIGGTSDNPLPIQLSSFTGVVVSDSEVRLDWTTASETNNYGFHVQKSFSQPDNFQTIANSFVPGHGTTNVPQQYTFTDNGAGTGGWYYRLEQIDLDGTTHYTDAILVDVLSSVDNPQAPLAFSLGQNYPNPFNPSTTISFSLAQGAMASLRVYNVIGQEVATLLNETMPAGRHEVAFDASALPSGLYVYRLQAGEHSETRKLMLMK